MKNVVIIDHNVNYNNYIFEFHVKFTSKTICVKFTKFVSENKYLFEKYWLQGINLAYLKNNWNYHILIFVTILVNSHKKARIVNIYFSIIIEISETLQIMILWILWILGSKNKIIRCRIEARYALILALKTLKKCKKKNLMFFWKL